MSSEKSYRWGRSVAEVEANLGALKAGGRDNAYFMAQ